MTHSNHDISLGALQCKKEALLLSHGEQYHKLATSCLSRQNGLPDLICVYGLLCWEACNDSFPCVLVRQPADILPQLVEDIRRNIYCDRGDIILCDCSLEAGAEFKR